MLRIANRKLLWTHEVVWFAEGEYDRKIYSADVTYFRQHRFVIPPGFVVSAEIFDTLVLDLTSSLDLLFLKLSKTSRYEVNRSEKEKISVRQAVEPDSVNRFIEHHRDFNRKKKLGTPTSSKQLLKYKHQWLLYSAFHNDTWLGHLLLLHDDLRARQWVLTNNTDFTDRALLGYASKALVWYSICDAKKRGFSIYDFGGIVMDELDALYGVTRFKMSFGGSHVQEQNSLVIPNSYYRAFYKMVRPD